MANIFPIPRSLREALAILTNLPVALLAMLWRRLLYRTTFIAVTGSFGKTTAKDFLAAILSRVGPTVKTQGSANGRGGIERTILGARPHHRFVVVEIGTDRPGGMIRASLVVRPNVAIILNVGRAHAKEFRSLDRIASEKASLLRFLKKDGVAVLNGDDPRVAAMAATCPGKVLLFGSSEKFDVCFLDPAAVWPGRLEFTVVHAGQKAAIKTQLVGVHWAPAVTGAVAAALACGATLSQAVDASASVEPYVARMQPVTLPGGIIMLRDEHIGSVDGFEQAFHVLSQARATRRILVISDYTDSKKRPRQRMRDIARLASRTGIALVFVGERSLEGMESARKEGIPPENSHGFLHMEEAAAFLRTELRRGDLILLRGRMQDHLSRLYFQILGSVSCRLTKCGRRRPCDDCSKLGFKPMAPNVF